MDSGDWSGRWDDGKRLSLMMEGEQSIRERKGREEGREGRGMERERRG